MLFYDKLKCCKINKCSFFVRLILFTFAFALILFSFYLIFISYNEFVYRILSLSGKLDKINLFKTDYLPSGKFQLIRYFITLITITYLIIILQFTQKIEKTSCAFIKYIYEIFVSEIQSISKGEKYLFIAVFTLTSILKIYYYYAQPITNDEAFTFLNYVNPGFAAAISYYNLTNNHILHSILCNIFNLLPISPVYSLRITSLLASSISLFIAFLFYRRYLSTKAAFIAFVLYALMPVSVQYGFLARGYSLLLLFTFISTAALLSLTNNSKNKKYNWIIYIISSSLGFYSIPVYIHVFASQIIFYLAYLIINKQKLNSYKPLIANIIIISLLVAMLYSPVVIISGLNSLIGNEYVQPIGFSQFISEFKIFLIHLPSWFFAGNIYLSVVVYTMVLGGIVYSFFKNRILFLVIISAFFTPLCLNFALRVMPLNRIFIFILIFISLALGLFIEFIEKAAIRRKIRIHWILYAFTALMVFIMITDLNTHCRLHAEKNNKAYTFANLISSNSSIYSTNTVRYYTFLKFKAQFLDMKDIHLYRKNFDGNFPYIYISENKDKNEHIVKKSKYHYLKIYEDEYVILYKLTKK